MAREEEGIIAEVRATESKKLNSPRCWHVDVQRKCHVNRSVNLPPPIDMDFKGSPLRMVWREFGAMRSFQL